MVTSAIGMPEWDTLSRRRVFQRADADLGARAREMVAQHSHFHGRTNNFQFVRHDDVLVVRGRVPSFYLKQQLQVALKQLDGVRWVDNQVDVVACDGLSSVRNRD